MLQCDFCLKCCLTPGDKAQHRRHQDVCIKAQVQEIDKKFAQLKIKNLREKTCDICLEVVMRKEPAIERRFGILPKCKHTFCFSCIKTWRNTADYSDTVKKGCPTCRVQSNFFFPSPVWVENDKEKKRQFAIYRAGLKKKDCKNYRGGAGVCPYGERCYFRHATSSAVCFL